ncbi:MAG: KH domain-containing protein [Thermoleophilaceae bacterium]|nr:KH domain-containing protein [Thermoleophilaceae bacterium]
MESGAHGRIEVQAPTVGEAKWAAAKALEHQFPGVTADQILFDILEEGDGGGQDARVGAEVDVEAWAEQVNRLPDEPAERVRALLSRIVLALDLRSSVDVVETDDEIRATVNGDDLGLFIGKHGNTIDAVQQLAARAAFRGISERKLVIVDAAGYRERREQSLKRSADTATEDALSFGRSVELEPMSAHERKVVHRYLSDRTEVQTHSEGDEPDRRLVVTPTAA